MSWTSKDRESFLEQKADWKAFQTEQQEAKLGVGLGGTSRQVGRVPGTGCLLGVCYDLRDHTVAEALGVGVGRCGRS